MMELMDYIAEQPNVWRQILAGRENLLRDFRKLCESVRPDRIMLLGSGTSFHAGLAVRGLFSAWFGAEVSVQYPSLFESGGNPASRQLAIGISQTGASAAVIETLRRTRLAGVPSVAVTAGADSPLSRESDCTVLIRCGEETAGPKTKGYTATVLTLCLMAALGPGRPEPDVLIEALSRAAGRAGKVVADADRWYAANREELTGAGHLVVVGDGVNYGTALEGALKLLETVRCPAAGYEFEEYLHGPYNALGPDSTLLYLNPAGRNQQRMFRLADFASGITPRNYMLTDDPARACGRNMVLERQENAVAVPLLYILPLQVLAARLSTDRGIRAFFPRYPDFHQRMGSKL